VHGLDFKLQCLPTEAIPIDRVGKTIDAPIFGEKLHSLRQKAMPISSFWRLLLQGVPSNQPLHRAGKRERRDR